MKSRSPSFRCTTPASALLEYDPSTDRGTASDAAAVRRYYLHTSNSLTREAPLVSRSGKLMIRAHDTDVGNLLGIFRPMEHLEVPGCTFFYAPGHRLYGHEWDNHKSPLQHPQFAKSLSGEWSVEKHGEAWTRCRAAPAPRR